MADEPKEIKYTLSFDTGPVLRESRKVMGQFQEMFLKLNAQRARNIRHGVLFYQRTCPVCGDIGTSLFPTSMICSGGYRRVPHVPLAIRNRTVWAPPRSNSLPLQDAFARLARVGAGASEQMGLDDLRRQLDVVHDDTLAALCLVYATDLCPVVVLLDQQDPRSEEDPQWVT